MPSIWSGKLKHLREIHTKGLLVETMCTGFMQAFGNPTNAEIISWSTSIPALLDTLSDSEFDCLQAILELQMPVGAERADVVLLGGTQRDPKAVVIELKQWTSVKIDPQSTDIILPGYGRFQHPSIQALNYRGKLHLFHSRASQYNISALSFLHNMDEARTTMLKNCFSNITKEKPLIYGKDDTDILAVKIRQQLLPCELDPMEHLVFRDAPYEQTRHLFNVITQNASDIANNAVCALAEAGMGLTEEQECLVEEVLAAARNSEKQVFVVQGGPGSGKTLIAVTLLLRAIKERIRCVLAIRNNRLQAILRRCFDQAYPGASGTMMYFEVPRTQTGIGDIEFKGTFDLIICDEAQRMRAISMPRVLNRAATSVIFLDETQRLNPPEQGTMINFVNVIRDVQSVPNERRLTAAVRCRGGQPYHNWIELLLKQPSESYALALDRQRWRDRYQLKTFTSVEDMIKELKTVGNIPGHRVAMVASFTESPGNIKNSLAPDNLRIGYPLTSNWAGYRESATRIYWLMQPNEYVNFWMKRGSNALDRVASIYGAQGFESDYVGIIWGRDMVFREGNWQLNDPQVCYDTIDGLVSRRGIKRWCEGALDLLRNRYRIFLTRGIMGTFIFCEDPETREWLRNLLTDC